MIFQPMSGGGGLSVIGFWENQMESVDLSKPAKFVLASPGNGYSAGSGQMILPGKNQTVITGSSLYVRVSLSSDGERISLYKNGSFGVDLIAVG